jgi:hypothetical protein
VQNSQLGEGLRPRPLTGLRSLRCGAALSRKGRGHNDARLLFLLSHRIRFSRRICVRVLQAAMSNICRAGEGAKHRAHAVVSGTVVRVGFATLSTTLRRRKKGSGTPADAVFHVPYASGARVAPRKGGLRRPPLAGALACRRSTTALAAATERHRSAPANALPAAELGRSGCYPLPAAMRLSGFPRRPVIVPAGRIDPEPPENGADNPARRNRPRPSPPASPGGVLSGRDDALCNCNGDRRQEDCLRI